MDRALSRFHSFLPLWLAAVPLLSSSAATPSSSTNDVDFALQHSVELLLDWQEEYQVDRPVGTLPEEELPKWQKEEAERLAKLRDRATAAREWPYEGVYRVGPDGRIPAGYRVGGTALTCEAIILTPGFDEFEQRREAVARSLAFIVELLETSPELEAGPKVRYDVRGWGHAYALDLFLLVRKLGIGGELTPKIEQLIPDLIQRLAKNETSQGGWNYAENRSISPFMTGSTLLALYEARGQGFDVDTGLVERALAGLERGRTSIGSFAYAGRARGDVEMPGSAARSAIAELVLYGAGRSDARKLRQAVDGFFAGWSELLKRKSQQGTHVGKYSIAPYYFFYGHTYAALAIEQLPAEERAPLREKMKELLWQTRDDDGSWNDRVFPRSASYSTSMVSLALLAPRIERTLQWKTESADAPDPTDPIDSVKEN